MKHKPMLIKGNDLYNRLFSDSDWHEPELADALGLETKQVEGVDLVNWTPEACDAWWKVTWPEHVVSASFDSDATYSEIRPEDFDVIVKNGALVYGELEERKGD